MSLPKSENSIKLNIVIRPSFFFFIIISLFNLSLLWAGLLITDSYIQNIVISVIAIISFYYYINLYLLRKNKKSIYSVILDHKDNWYLEYNNKKFKKYDIDKTSYISNGLIVLYFKISRYKKFAVPLFVDAIGKDEFYELKKYLLNKDPV